MAIKTYDPEFKQSVVDSLLSGESLERIAKQFKISPATLYRWKQSAPGKAAATTKATPLTKATPPAKAKTMALAVRATTPTNGLAFAQGLAVGMTLGGIQQATAQIMDRGRVAPLTRDELGWYVKTLETALAELRTVVA